MHIICNITVLAFCLCSTVIYAQLPARHFPRYLPRLFPVIRYIRHTATAKIYPLQFSLRCENRMRFTECNQFFYKIMQFFLLFQSPPICPSYRIILTVYIIITFLRISKLISCKHTRSSLCQKEQEKCIKYLMIPQFHYCLFPARSFRPAIPAIIIIRSILIMFTILLIVFRIVRHQIIQGKSVLISNVVKDSLLF